MAEGLENLAKMEYPGRFIILGMDLSGEQGVVVYGVTGRSQSSQARKFVFSEEHDVLRTDVTDKEQLEKGSPALLIYPAMARKYDAIIVSNGAQTNLLYETIENEVLGAEAIVREAMNNRVCMYDSKLGFIDITGYEPDAPNNTPRISGAITPKSPIKKPKGALHIVRKGINFRHKEMFPFYLEPGKGYLIATYKGANENPLQGFDTEPLEVKITGTTQEDIANAVYETIAPKEGKDDLRVAVACWFAKEKKPYIINRHDIETGKKE